MHDRLFSGTNESFVSPFVARFAGNVCLAVAKSLKAPDPVRSIHYELRSDFVGLRIDGVEVPLDKNQGFAGTIVLDTLRGMIRHLKGLEPEGDCRIEVEIGA